MTSQKLFTAVTSAIRSYRDLKIIDKSRQGLEQIIEASANLLKLGSLKQFTNGVLTQLTSFLGLDESSLFIQTSSFAATHDGSDFFILAGTGQFEKYVGRRVREVEENHIQEDLALAAPGEKRFSGRRPVRGLFHDPEQDGERGVPQEPPVHKRNGSGTGGRVSSQRGPSAFDNVYHRENLEKLVEERTEALKTETDKVLAAQRVLARYVPPQLTERILAGQIDEVWEHARRRLTMLFFGH